MPLYFIKFVKQQKRDFLTNRASQIDNRALISGYEERPNDIAIKQ